MSELIDSFENAVHNNAACFGNSATHRQRLNEARAELKAAILSAASPAPGVTAFAEEVMQLCEDFSGRDGSVYIKDVQSAIDSLVARFGGAASPASAVVPEGWIPVEERLPKCDDDMLVYSRKDGQRIAAYHREQELWFTPTAYAVRAVTHWQPLPAAPLSASPPTANDGEQKGGERG